MENNINKSLKYITSNIEVWVAIVIFLAVVITGNDFYGAIILMLEFIVIMEVVKMVSDFITQKALHLRYVLDIFIIFLIREVIILSVNKSKDYIDIVFLLFVIFVFFIFRILAVKFSPDVDKKDSQINKLN